MPGEQNGKQERRLRAGGYALSLLATPMNVAILQALREGPKPMSELRRSAGAPPQTTVRKHLRALAEIGVLAKERSNGFPATVSYSLCKPGSDLVGVARAVEGWLASAPDGPIELGTVAARSAIKALIEGWSTTLIRALASRSLSLTELDALIAGVNYPSLERRLVAMRMAGQVKPTSTPGRSTPYAVTNWLRRAISPLANSACWERAYLPSETTPIGRLDIESAFLLTVPLLSLAPDVSGACELRVETSRRDQPNMVGVLAILDGGRVTYCGARQDEDPDAKLSGSITAWFRAVAEGRLDLIDVAGDQLFAAAILDGLHANLAKPALS